MTIKEFVDTNWHRGNVVRLKNGKEYLVKGTKGHGRWLLLYSEEYDAKFVADYRIVDCRTSDYEEPEEVYLEKKRKHQEEAAAKREAERQEYLREKAERKQNDTGKNHIPRTHRKECVERTFFADEIDCVEQHTRHDMHETERKGYAKQIQRSVAFERLNKLQFAKERARYVKSEPTAEYRAPNYR